VFRCKKYSILGLDMKLRVEGVFSMSKTLVLSTPLVIPELWFNPSTTKKLNPRGAGK
jgi:hypothetical protein